jgi:hypothetical protein
MGTNVTSNKTIHSRSNKNIGDVIEGEWEITGRKVIAEPIPAGNGQPPRFGIYEYEVKAIRQAAPPPKATRAKHKTEPDVGGTRREAATVPTVRRTH